LPNNRGAPTRRTQAKGTNARGQATRELLLVTAERLFAERGIAAVPMRDIAQAAGQRNNTAIPYHFGDREGLIRAITIYRGRPTEELRAKMLADLLDQPTPVRVHDLVTAMIAPLVIHFDEGNHNLAFQARLLTERGEFANASGELPGAMAMIPELLCRRLPHMPEETVRLRYTMAITSAIHTLAHYQDLLQAGRLPQPLDALINDMINFLSAGIDAPFESGASELDVG